MKGFEFLLKEYVKKHTYTMRLKEMDGVHTLLDVCETMDNEGFCTAIEIIDEAELHTGYLVHLMEEIRKEVADNE